MTTNGLYRYGNCWYAQPLVENERKPVRIKCPDQYKRAQIDNKIKTRSVVHPAENASADMKSKSVQKKSVTLSKKEIDLLLSEQCDKPNSLKRKHENSNEVSIDLACSYENDLNAGNIAFTTGDSKAAILHYTKLVNRENVDFHFNLCAILESICNCYDDLFKNENDVNKKDHLISESYSIFERYLNVEKNKKKRSDYFNIFAGVLYFQASKQLEQKDLAASFENWKRLIEFDTKYVKLIDGSDDEKKGLICDFFHNMTYCIDNQKSFNIPTIIDMKGQLSELLDTTTKKKEMAFIGDGLREYHTFVDKLSKKYDVAAIDNDTVRDEETAADALLSLKDSDTSTDSSSVESSLKVLSQLATK